MQEIDLKKLIEERDLDVKVLAKQLFPKHKHGSLALNRVIKKEGHLDTVQISKLALFIGVEISDLYVGAWKSKTSKSTHLFSNGEYTAILDTKTWITKIFHNKSLFHESVLHNGSISLSDYFNKLNYLILKFKKNET